MNSEYRTPPHADPLSWLFSNSGPSQILGSGQEAHKGQSRHELLVLADSILLLKTVLKRL